MGKLLVRLTVFMILAGVVMSAPPPQPNVDEFFERVATEWVRNIPELSTTSEYLNRQERERLDRKWSPSTPVHSKEAVERARKALAELRSFDWKSFTPAQRTSARVMEDHLNGIVRRDPFARVRYPFHQYGMPGGIVDFLTFGHRIRNETDCESYLARLETFGDALDEYTAMAREDAKNGIVAPDFILTATIGQIDRLTNGEPDRHILVTSFAERMSKLTGLTEARKQQLLAAATKSVAANAIPSLRRAAAAVREQLPKATADAGFWKLPNGAAAYAESLRTYTETDYTPDQIHQIGLEQVARIEKEMDKALRELGYRDGSVKDRYRRAMEETAYKDSPNVRTQILADYDAIVRDAEKRAASLFDRRPKAAVEVRRVPEFREKNTAAAYYVPPAKDGSAPGIFFVPLPGPPFERTIMRSRTYHEAVPGHHFQRSLDIENTSLPRFRRLSVFGSSTANGEGWGLYSEMLALENGWYEGDPLGRLGAWERQLFRARRLVVDTGIHAKKWTRQQAIDYGLPPAEVERYIVWPGQACAYMMGQLKIQELRDKARRELGDRFSVKEFHNVVLGAGAVPLTVLSDLIDEYIAAKRGA